MANKPRYSRRTLREAITGSRGIKVAIAQRLGCSRQTLDSYLLRFPDLNALLADERDSIIDLAESKLLKAVNAEDWRAVQFVLETLGKGRGWSRRTEVTGADGAPLGLSPDVVALMAQLGIEASAVVAQFEQMIREQAAVEADKS